MFTDIVSSTAIKAAMGDDTYFRDVLEPHNRLVREQIAQHQGRELKTIGDAFLVAFSSPAQAVGCACGIQERLRGFPLTTTPGQRLEVRIGIHTGEPKVYRDPVSGRIDLSGTAVDKAARVEALAHGDQILISEQTQVLANPPTVHDWQGWELKGLGRHRIFEMLYPGKEPQRPSGRPWLRPVRYLTQFVGRQNDLDRAMHAILHHLGRLVTLRGMGGIGKSRLADEVAARVSQAFDDDVVCVELAAVPDSAQAVAAELVARLGIELRAAGEEATLLAGLQNRRLLLVLDTFEAVMAAAPLLGRLLRGCPGLHLLVTSQRLLGVDGEQQVEVRPMPLPEPVATLPPDRLQPLDSFQLFRDRARLRRPDWDVGPQEAPLLAAILAATDGIPLAIELAAAWVDQVPLQELRDGLVQCQAEYLQRRGSAVEEPRHASMQSCVAWSVGLLAPEERALFAQLAVFPGGCFPEDVAAVCQTASAAPLLRVLEARSLLSWEERRGQARYHMLPTVRVSALDQLGDLLDPLQRRHATHYLGVLDRADDGLTGAAHLEARQRITDDLDNIRAGMEAVRRFGDHRAIVRYALAFVSYLAMTARFGERLLRSEQGLEATQAMKDPRLAASCQNNLGTAYQSLPTGDRGANLQRAIDCYEAALRVRTERDFPVQWATTQNNMGTAYADLPTGDRGANLAKAVAGYEAAIRGFEKAGLHREADEARKRLEEMKEGEAQG